MDDLFAASHQLTPPTTEDDRLAWLRLIRSYRVGTATFFRLLAEHGSAQAALEMLPGIAKAAGVKDYTACSLDNARREIAAARKIGAQLLCFGTNAYPAALADIADAPPLLWALGDTALLSRPMVAMVGARNASSLGLRMARKLAEGLGEAGVVVVSGLARGIDAAAHLAALPRGTIAVQAGGLDVIYPTENKDLHEEIAIRGLRLSEQPIGLEPQARHFPIRNRIVSGLAQAVIVVEAASRSGSLLTARDALDQGRDVMAVPGHPFDARAYGCNMLIRDGAVLVRSSADVLEALAAKGCFVRPTAAPTGSETAATPVCGITADASSIRGITADASSIRGETADARIRGETADARIRGETAGPTGRSLSETSALHSRILDRLGPSPLAEDQLIRDLDLPAARVASELLNLELEGLILRQAGGLLSRIN